MINWYSNVWTVTIRNVLNVNVYFIPSLIYIWYWRKSLYLTSCQQKPLVSNGKPFLLYLFTAGRPIVEPFLRFMRIMSTCTTGITTGVSSQHFVNVAQIDRSKYVNIYWCVEYNQLSNIISSFFHFVFAYGQRGWREGKCGVVKRWSEIIILSSKLVIKVAFDSVIICSFSSYFVGFYWKSVKIYLIAEPCFGCH